jgi:disulfide bond formation protein DsbB
MYPLAIILLVGAWRQDDAVFFYVLPFSILGIGFSSYHYLLQKTEFFAASTVCDTGIPCTTTWINILGFITIPFLALLGFLIITFCGLLFWAQEEDAVKV